MVTLGTDPEIFLRVAKTKELIPACGLIGGTKDKPLALGDGYAVQEDNVMLEYNTPPTEDPYAFVDRVVEGMKRSMEKVNSLHPGLEFAPENERLFGFDLLADEQAMQFGCSPDFNAHNMGAANMVVNPQELEAEDGAWRFAGGHVHIGYNKPKTANLPHFVAACFADVFLGLPTVGLDLQTMRRNLYGQPGRYRPTKYGIEYRTLSNFWVMDINLMEQVAHRAYYLGHFLESADETRLQRLYRDVPWADVQAAISEENPDRAADVLAYVRHDLGVAELA